MNEPALDSEADDKAWRKARRQALRQHHPDVGGSAEDMAAALAEVDLRFGKTPDVQNVAVEIVAAGGFVGQLREVLKAIKKTFSKRRYIDISDGDKS